MIEKKIGSVKVIECRGSHGRIGETIGEALRAELQQLIALSWLRAVGAWDGTK